MATGQLRTFLRHVHKLAETPFLESSSDAQLLRRFVEQKEEAAFTVLVQRHGPMVLGVCRRILRDTHEADDAFQATFVVLLRKANAVKGYKSVAGWLYTVAYHTAINAKTCATRREQRQGELTDMPAKADNEILWRDLKPILDEELNGLPVKYRDAIALCYLEEKTCAQAGERLGCPAGTIKSRLARARKLLQARLQRRGVTLTGSAVAAVLADCATAGVSAVLVQTTLQTALLTMSGNAAVNTAVNLAEGVLQTMFTNKLKVGSACFVLFGLLLLGVGQFSHHAAAQHENQTTHVANEDAAKNQVVETDDKPKSGEVIVVTGRVQDVDEKPVAKAAIAVIGLPKHSSKTGLFLLDEKVLAKTTTDAVGGFQTTVSKSVLQRYERLYALAGARGKGVVWKEISLEPNKLDTVLLMPPELIVSGRLMNLQGQPASGVHVKIGWQGTTANAGADIVRLGAMPEKDFPEWPRTAITDKAGKFVIRGVNPNLTGSIWFESGRYAKEWESIRGNKKTYEQKIVKVLSPAQIIEGVVTASDTRKPIANAQILVYSDNNVNAPRAMGAGETAKTDASGRFRINPPVGKLYTIRATAPNDRPYLLTEETFKWRPAAVHHTIDLTLPRGIVVRGIVKERDSGKPVASAIVRDDKGLWVNPSTTTKADGSFQITVAPGRRHLIVKGPNNDYVPLEVTNDELKGNKPRGRRFYPDGLIPLNLKADTKVHHVEAILRRGVTIRGQLLKPDGNPPKHAVMLCWNQVRQSAPSWFAARVHLQDGQFELRGCEPNRTYTVFFLDAHSQLGATVEMSFSKAKDKPVTVLLKKCGSATVRFVDQDGEPLSGYEPTLFFVARKAMEPFADDQDFAANVDRQHHRIGQATDDKGRMTFQILIPGATYRVRFGGFRSAHDFQVEPSQSLQMPDLIVKQN